MSSIAANRILIPTVPQLVQQYPSLAELHNDIQVQQRDHDIVPYADWATLYALSVLRGKTPACLHIKAACSRFILDLWRQDNDSSFGYYLNRDVTNKYLSFMESLPFVQGKQGRKLENFTLAGFQIFLCANLFGWLHSNEKDHIRRFTRGYVLVPRKNGKTTAAVAMSYASLCLDEEDAPQVVFIANKVEQAKLSFTIAKLMAKRAKWLQSDYGIVPRHDEIRCGLNNGTIQALPSAPGDGGNATFCIQDEYHEALTSNGYDAIINGMTARQQPLMLVITTAGEDITLPWYIQKNYASDVVNGKIQDENYFSMLYELDDQDLEKWNERDTWYKINPNLGVSLEPRLFEQLATEAQNSPLKKRTFLVKRLNRPQRLGAAIFDIEKWHTLKVERDLSVLKGARMWCGSDLAFIEDFAVIGGLIELPGKPAKYRAEFQCWLPEQRLQSLNPTFREWGSQGWIKTTPGNLLDMDELVKQYKTYCDHYKVQIIQNDPNHASQLLVRLGGLGVPVVPLAQTARNLSEPLKWLIGMVNAGLIEHDGNPVIEWMMGNVVAREDAGERLYPMRSASNRNIDAVIAMIIAASGLIKQVGAEMEFRSYWSDKKGQYVRESQDVMQTALEKLVKATKYD